MKGLILGLLLSVALSGVAGDAGMVASNANTIIDSVTDIVMVILYIAAMVVMVSATMKYRIHRQNPQQIPLSTPITELILAIVLAAIPTVTRITDGELFSSDSEEKMPQAPVYIAPRPVAVPPPAQPYQPPR